MNIRRLLQVLGLVAGHAGFHAPAVYETDTCILLQGPNAAGADSFWNLKSPEMLSS